MAPTATADSPWTSSWLPSLWELSLPASACSWPGRDKTQLREMAADGGGHSSSPLPQPVGTAGAHGAAGHGGPPELPPALTLPSPHSHPYLSPHFLLDLAHFQLVLIAEHLCEGREGGWHQGAGARAAAPLQGGLRGAAPELEGPGRGYLGLPASSAAERPSCSANRPSSPWGAGPGRASRRASPWSWLSPRCGDARAYP